MNAIANAWTSLAEDTSAHWERISSWVDQRCNEAREDPKAFWGIAGVITFFVVVSLCIGFAGVYATMWLADLLVGTQIAVTLVLCSTLLGPPLAMGSKSRELAMKEDFDFAEAKFTLFKIAAFSPFGAAVVGYLWSWILPAEQVAQFLAHVGYQGSLGLMCLKITAVLNAMWLIPTLSTLYSKSLRELQKEANQGG